jgi:hypothetical protein
MKPIYFFLFMILAACGKDDNYSTPDASIKGQVIDDITKQPIQTETPNGIRIRLLEKKYATPSNYDFWVKADGTYENSQLFSGTYDVRPIEGAFFPVDVKEVNIQGITEVNFTVVPYLAITATATAASGTVTLKYKLSRSQVAGKITESRVMASSIPTVNINIYDVINNSNKSVTRNLNGVTDDTILATEYTDAITGLVSGKSYYVRVAARTATIAKYNYSPVIKINVP